MGLLAQRASQPKPRKTTCQFGQLFDRPELDDDDKAVLEGRSVSASDLSKFLAELDMKVSQTLIRDHRNRNCVCFRTEK